MITENKFVTKGGDVNIPFQAFRAGVEIDLSSATVIFAVKEYETDTSPVFQLKNTAAGGNDNQILVVSAEDGLFLAKLTSTNTGTLSVKAYYYSIVCNDGASEITHSGSLIVQQSVNDGSVIALTYGTTAQRPSLTTANVGYMYFDTDLDSAIWWNGTDWV